MAQLSPSLSSLSVRGGLGKTLLIAFLLLAIVPLGLLAFVTYDRIQHDTQERLLASLETVAMLKQDHLVDWTAARQRELALVAAALDRNATIANKDRPAELEAQLAVLQPSFTALFLVDAGQGELLSMAGPLLPGLETLSWLPAGAARLERRLVISPIVAQAGQPACTDLYGGDCVAAVSYGWEDRLLVGLLSWQAVRAVVMAADDTADGRIITSLVTGDGLLLAGQDSLEANREQVAASAGLEALRLGQTGSAAYQDLAGVPVFGAYRWIPELGIGILAEQAQSESLATGNALTALVVGSTLAVALITAAIAAVVTRQITRPIVQLTAKAAWMARGDLNQRVVVARRDEIGVLAEAFNRMAAELQILYGNLEAKVTERTQQLEKANDSTRYYVVQLAISAEVARVASSIRDLNELLSTVVDLIGRSFDLYRTSIYLFRDSTGPEGRNGLLEQRATWQAVCQGQPAGPVDHASAGPDEGEREPGERALLERVAAAEEMCVIEAEDQEYGVSLRPPVQCEMIVPLRVRGRALGVLDVQSSGSRTVGEDDQVIYRSLADQISVAIENARAYALERETIERLQELDKIQAEFLTNMSHALRTPLNSIIGFSRVMLKGLDGPLSDVQHTDLTTIYASGRQLLGLINDMLELSQLDLGVAPFEVSEVDLAEIIEGVMATAQALARSKPVQLQQAVPDDLPLVYTDRQRVRQVILALLANAVKFTDEGSIRLLVATEPGRVRISVSDTGAGISRVERERIFADNRPAAGRGNNGHLSPADGADDLPGFGLAISRRVVEKLGGQIWVESTEGVGSTFTFTLPTRPTSTETAPAQRIELVTE